VTKILAADRMLTFSKNANARLGKSLTVEVQFEQGHSVDMGKLELFLTYDHESSLTTNRCFLHKDLIMAGIMVSFPRAEVGLLNSVSSE